MGLSVGIVGLPNVGKSTLFNALSSAKAEAANYPFCTIEPNVGVVAVPDARLAALDSVVHADRIVPATIDFVDIAGLVRGAHKGEGLGNQFLANIRETDAIAHVVRCFEDDNIVHVENIEEILYAMQQKFQAATSHLEMEFPYFMVKKAPVSEMESVMDYVARFDATAFHKEIDFVLTVKAMVTTLCPCSKAIAARGAHNQRGEVTVQIRSKKAVWIEDLIGIIESSASSELYALLKRQDEKEVTERAYDNPVFVEDLVRNVAVKLNGHPDVTWYKVEAENHESIHNHNAYACIEKG